jgi:glycosyltransferase involved in cell wall biosynthesis
MINNKIILIGMGKPTGPVPIHYLALGNELLRRGYKVHILMHSRVPLEKNNEILPIHFWKWRPTNKFARIYDFIYATRMIIKYKPICVISGHRDTGSLIFAGFLLRTKIRVKWHHILTSQTDIDGKESKLRLKLGRIAKTPFYSEMCTHIVGVSKFAIKDMERVYKVRSEKLQLLYNSLLDPRQNETDSSVFLTGAVEERLVCFGRLNISKGQDVLIRAIGLLKDNFPKIKLFIIGGGPCDAPFKALVKDLGLNDHINFIGVISHEKAMSILASGSISIIPSRMDNLPTTGIEALSLGVPVISTLTGGIPEIVENNYDGILVKVDDPRALANSIKLLLEDNEMREKMSVNARKSFLERFEQKRGVMVQADWIDGIISN